jgi:hypothetical protein
MPPEAKARDRTLRCDGKKRLSPANNLRAEATIALLLLDRASHA